SDGEMDPAQTGAALAHAAEEIIASPIYGLEQEDDAEPKALVAPATVAEDDSASIEAVETATIEGSGEAELVSLSASESDADPLDASPEVDVEADESQWVDQPDALMPQVETGDPA